MTGKREVRRLARESAAALLRVQAEQEGDLFTSAVDDLDDAEMAEFVAEVRRIADRIVGDPPS